MNKLLMVLTFTTAALVATAVSAAAVFTKDQANATSLTAILDAQHDEVKARYQYRHPQQTLDFFGIKPGMTVVEALPGGGWYSKILLPYLGEQGTLIGADYPVDLYSSFGFMNEERLKAKETWTTDWVAQAQAWEGDNHAQINAFVLGSLPETMKGTADAVVFIRATHNLARFSFKADFLGAALKSAYDSLKPGGIFGVVQHQAAEAMPDDWANGKNGYLKKSFVIEQATAAGFELLAESDVNVNLKDEPSTSEYVWRLPPSLRLSGDDPKLKAKFKAIGESNRMTLKFVKR